MSDVGSTRRASVAALVGRRDELDFLQSFVGRATTTGAALLLTGEAGVGKTALLEAVAQAATDAGARVLRASGVEFEADVGYSALNQVLLPLRADLPALREVHRDALAAALGLADVEPSNRLVVSNAALALLQAAAASRPLLVIIDDVQWVDRQSAAVIGFAARRLQGSPVGVLAASRPDEDSFFDRSGLPELEIDPLDEEASKELVEARFPVLAARVRQRLLTEACGNPLALLELPVALTDPQRLALQALPEVLPLSERLQALFATRVAAVPVSTRAILLLAALEETGDLGVIQAAAGGADSLADLPPAERARLVRVEEGARRIVFRHPLIRSAVVSLATLGERRAAHRSLADALADSPERRVWHLAEATVEPDEHVADYLEDVAQRVMRRGDAVGAVTVLLRAADLSPRRADRSRRLAAAAYLGANVTGELRASSQLLIDAREGDPDLGASLQAAMASSFVLLSEDCDLDSAHRLLVAAIESLDRYDADDDVLIEALHTLLLLCSYGRRDELWEPFDAVLARLDPAVPVLLSVSAQTLGDPARTRPEHLDQLSTLIAGLGSEVDPTRIVRIARAASNVDRATDCREALWRVVRDGREGGAIGSAIGGLILLCFDHLITGQWDEASELAEEGVALCDGHGYGIYKAGYRFALSTLAALRGDDEAVRAINERMQQWAVPRGVHVVAEYVAQTQCIAALGRGDHEDAYACATAISPPGALPPRSVRALSTGLDLVEAAMRTGRTAEAAAHVAVMHEAGVAAISPRCAVRVAGAAAIAAPEHLASGLFERALATPDIARFPYEVARVQLAYGEHLRRDRALVEARNPLSAALDTFRRLGARPWVTRAANEMRATGLPTPVADDLGPASLTAQEREIAMLAASGLSNKQIGERLYLSHRTVGAHLYRIFPKLGITSRAALRDALESSSVTPS
jgi:DNA-binding CsgD family transcriptional regulator